MYTIDERRKKKPKNKRKSSQKTRRPCFLHQTQKRVHNMREKKKANKYKHGMRQTMPHVYKMSKYPKDKG
jgi:hypothetical protein